MKVSVGNCKVKQNLYFKLGIFAERLELIILSAFSKLER